MRTVILCAVVLVLASSLASAAVQTFDTLGFEGYSLGDLSGQQGWYTELYGGTATVVDSSADPAEGSKALKLTAPSSVDDTVNVGQVIGDSIYIAHNIATSPLNWAKVSLDIWREPGTVTISDTTYNKADMNRLHWWAEDPTSTTSNPITALMGAQWEDMFGDDFDGGTTSPFLWSLDANSALTMTGSFVNLTIYYDFIAKTRSAWYDGALVCDAIPIDDDLVTGFKDIELYYEQISPTYEAGTFGYAAYIDNLKVEYEVTPVPEPGSLIALSVGIIGLVGLRRRRR